LKPYFFCFALFSFIKRKSAVFEVVSAKARASDYYYGGMSWLGSGSSSSSRQAKTFGRNKVAGSSAFASTGGGGSAFSIPGIDATARDLDDNPFSSQSADRIRQVPNPNKGLRPHDVNVQNAQPMLDDDALGKNAISKRKNPHSETDQKKKKEARAATPPPASSRKAASPVQAAPSSSSSSSSSSGGSPRHGAGASMGSAHSFASIR
jgi:hypothetical protein